jgi:hypothetical protein
MFWRETSRVEKNSYPPPRTKLHQACNPSSTMTQDKYYCILRSMNTFTLRSKASRQSSMTIIDLSLDSDDDDESSSVGTDKETLSYVSSHGDIADGRGRHQMNSQVRTQVGSLSDSTISCT